MRCCKCECEAAAAAGGGRRDIATLGVADPFIAVWWPAKRPPPMTQPRYAPHKYYYHAASPLCWALAKNNGLWVLAGSRCKCSLRASRALAHCVSLSSASLTVFSFYLYFHVASMHYVMKNTRDGYFPLIFLACKMVQISLYDAYLATDLKNALKICLDCKWLIYWYQCRLWLIQ